MGGAVDQRGVFCALKSAPIFRVFHLMALFVLSERKCQIGFWPPRLGVPDIPVSAGFQEGNLLDVYMALFYFYFTEYM